MSVRSYLKRRDVRLHARSGERRLEVRVPHRADSRRNDLQLGALQAGPYLIGGAPSDRFVRTHTPSLTPIPVAENQTARTFVIEGDKLGVAYGGRLTIDRAGHPTSFVLESGFGVIEHRRLDPSEAEPR